MIHLYCSEATSLADRYGLKTLKSDIMPDRGVEMSYTDVITIEPGKRGGKPCIRGM